MSNFRRNSTRDRYKLIKLYGRRCAYCKKEFTRRELTLDHVMPRSQGHGRIGNIVLACRPCNADKANKILPIANLQKLALDYPHLQINWQTFLQNHESRD